MSSSTEAVRLAQPRPVRWPWAVLAAFLSVAAVALVLVGRERRVGWPTDPVHRRLRDVRRRGRPDRQPRSPQRDRAAVPVGFVPHGVVLPCRRGLHLRHRPRRERWLARGHGTAQQLRLVVRDPPGGLPNAVAVPGWARANAAVASVPLVQRDVRGVDRFRPRLGSEDADGLGRIGLDRQPVLRRGRRAAPVARPLDRHLPSRHLRGIRRVSHLSLPSFDRRRTSADQVGGLRFGRGARRDHRDHLQQPGNDRDRVDRWCRVPAPASLHRDRDPALPSLRPRRGGAQDPDLRRLRALRNGHLPRCGGRRRRLAGTRQLVPHHGGGRGRGAHVSTSARAAHALRQPPRLRQARDAV